MRVIQLRWLDESEDAWKSVFIADDRPDEEQLYEVTSLKQIGEPRCEFRIAQYTGAEYPRNFLRRLPSQESTTK